MNPTPSSLEPNWRIIQPQYQRADDLASCLVYSGVYSPISQGQLKTRASYLSIEAATRGTLLNATTVKDAKTEKDQDSSVLN